MRKPIRKASSLLPFVVFISLVGCDRKSVGELKTGFYDVAYERTVETPGYAIRVRYLPPVLRTIMAHRLPDSLRPTVGLIDSLGTLTGASVGTGLLIRIDPKPAGSGQGVREDLVFGRGNGFGNYRSALEAFSTGLVGKIWIETEGGKIPLSSYQMENSFGMSGGRTFVLLFPPLESGGGKMPGSFALVLDDIVPGLSRKRLQWTLPVGKTDESL